MGDPLGMAVAHAQASGMGGMRAAGDLVARIMMTKGLRIDEAKKYVGDKLNLDAKYLTDPVLMSEVRADLGLGIMMPLGGTPKGMECKYRIAEVLDIKINCCERFKRLSGLA